MKAKIVFLCEDELWDKLKKAHRRKYPDDDIRMNAALTRAVEEFVVRK